MAEQLSDLRYYFVTLGPSGELKLHVLETREGLADLLRQLPAGTEGLPFLGRRLFVSEGPWRFLVGEGEPLPLFKPPKLGRLDKSPGLGQGKVGEDPEEPEYKKLMQDTCQELEKAAAAAAVVNEEEMPLG